MDSSMDMYMTMTETSSLKPQQFNTGIGYFFVVEAPNCAVGCLIVFLDSLSLGAIV